jgi:UrcA family protein
MKTQTTAKLITGIFAAALIAGLAGNSVAESPFTETRSSVVKFADLNLDTPKGVATLYKRIHNAAVQVCGDPSEDSVFSEVRVAQAKCVSESVARAIDSVHNPALEAYYSKKTGRPMPALASNQTK